jgi:hypothetical protein
MRYEIVTALWTVMSAPTVEADFRGANKLFINKAFLSLPSFSSLNIFVTHSAGSQDRTY